MKNKIIALCMLVAGWITIATATPVFKVNGEEITTTVQSITFDGDNAILLFSDGTTATHDMSIVEILFQGNTTLNQTTYILSQIIDGQLLIDNCTGNELVRIYDVAGRLMHQMRSEEGGFSIDVNHFNQGVYILQIGNQAVKFIKQ